MLKFVSQELQIYSRGQTANPLHTKIGKGEKIGKEKSKKERKKEGKKEREKGRKRGRRIKRRETEMGES